MELNKNEKKKLNDDLKKIEKNLVSDPHNSKFLYEEGVILEKLGNYRSAYTAYSMAHTYDPEMVMASDKMIVIEPKLDEIRKNEYKSLGEFLDREKKSEKSPERPSIFEHSQKSWLSDYTIENDRRYNKPFARNFNRRFYLKDHKNNRKTKFSNKLYIFLFYKRGLTTSVIISTILTAMLEFNLVLVNNYHSSEFLLGTYGFLVDFIMILLISLIINWRDKWASLISAFVISTLFGYIKLPNINSTTTFLGILLLLFTVLYLSTLLGNIIKHAKYNKIELYTSYSIKAILIVLAIVMIASLATNKVALSSLNSDMSSFSNIFSGSQAVSEPINSTWVSQFFMSINSYRSYSKLLYCPTLSTFAVARYKTMSSNIQISHYGYQQTFDSFWPNGYAYGGYIYSGFGEEVLYPNKPSSSTTTCVDLIFCSTSTNTLENYTPSQYIPYLIANAPLHWKELISNNYSYYGYYITNGPSYSIIGPNDGQSPCPTTEIPGPNINITQYFAQYGCTTEITGSTWLVIELAPTCPT